MELRESSSFSLLSLDVELRGEILSLADDLYDAWEGQPSLTDRYRMKRLVPTRNVALR
jgi:hypothetical protein